MALAPHFVKYKTKSGSCYVYDPGTNEIVCVDELIYRVLDDFHVLGEAEIIEKHRAFGEGNVRIAIRQVEALQSRGVLRDHAPKLSTSVKRVRCYGEEQPYDRFLQDHRRLLILELTQRCNLRCEYCCYGEHYRQSQTRSHGEENMSLDVAMVAVKDFLDHHPKSCGIGFYGGEPLLEFELLKNVVVFAEHYAGQFGLKPEFSMTTNGTLLTDETIRFLVEHDFAVTVSLDGPKEFHDRHRVFRHDPNGKQRAGSYDLVIKNLRRFVELYPQYSKRSIKVTLSAASNCSEINTFMAKLLPSTSGTADFVNDTPRRLQEQVDGPGVQIGSWTPCRSRFCGKDIIVSESWSENAGTIVAPSLSRETVVDSGIAPDFCNWTEERQRLFDSGFDGFMEELCRAPDADAIYNRFPLFFSFFAPAVAPIHRREIVNGSREVVFACRCHPDASRTFCSSRGVLYPCEKMNAADVGKLGDAQSGIDVRVAVQLTELVRLLGDCGNCVARKLCPICPASLSELNGSGIVDAKAFQAKCHLIMGSVLRTNLKEYTTFMEANQGSADKILKRTMDKLDDWAGHVRLVLPEEQQRENELRVEAGEGMA